MFSNTSEIIVRQSCYTAHEESSLLIYLNKKLPLISSVTCGHNYSRYPYKNCWFQQFILVSYTTRRTLRGTIRCNRLHNHFLRITPLWQLALKIDFFSMKVIWSEFHFSLARLNRGCFFCLVCFHTFTFHGDVFHAIWQNIM